MGEGPQEHEKPEEEKRLEGEKKLEEEQLEKLQVTALQPW
jgi:hypothetical protein